MSHPNQNDDLPPQEPLLAPLIMMKTDFRPEARTPYTKPRVKMPFDRAGLIAIILVLIVVALLVVWVLHTGGFGAPPPPPFPTSVP